MHVHRQRDADSRSQTRGLPKLAAGALAEEILDGYPQLSREDILAGIVYGLNRN